MKEVKLAVNFCFYLNHWVSQEIHLWPCFCGMCRLQKSLLTKGGYNSPSLLLIKEEHRAVEAILLRERNNSCILDRPSRVPQSMCCSQTLETPTTGFLGFLPSPPPSFPSLILPISRADPGQRVGGRQSVSITAPDLLPLHWCPSPFSAQCTRALARVHHTHTTYWNYPRKCWYWIFIISLEWILISVTLPICYSHMKPFS